MSALLHSNPSDNPRCHWCHKRLVETVTGYVHWWSHAEACGLGRSTVAEPEPES